MAAIPTPQNISAPAVGGDVNAAKAATLQALAAGGSAAAERVATAQAYTQQQGGVNGAAFASILGQQGQAQQNFYSSVGGNVANYSDEVNQAIPLEQAITGQQLNSLSAVASEREAERQQQMQLGQLQLQEEQARLAAANAGNDPNSVDGQIKQTQLAIDKANLAKMQDPMNSLSSVDISNRDQQALQQLLGGVDGGADSHAAAALGAALGGKSSDDMGTGMAALDALITPQTDAKGKTTTAYTTPNGKPLDRNYMQDQLRRYYAIRQALLAGQAVPAASSGSANAGSILGGGLVGSSGR